MPAEPAANGPDVSRSRIVVELRQVGCQSLDGGLRIGISVNVGYDAPVGDGHEPEFLCLVGYPPMLDAPGKNLLAGRTEGPTLV